MNFNMNLMKGRYLIILIGIPSWLFLIWLGSYFYTLFILTVMVLCLYEFYMVTMLNNKDTEIIGYIFSIIIAGFFHKQPQLNTLQLIGILVLTILFIYIWQLFIIKENPTKNISLLLYSIFYIPILLGTCISLRNFDYVMDANITFAIVASVWACDAAAFVIGSIWGSKKIFPRVSPNKSWLGSISGLLAAILVFYIFHKLDSLGALFNFNNAITMGVIVGIFGQVGDFYESLLKRNAGIKDSGDLLLGHGGVLDRFDSIIFASPSIFIYIHSLF